MKIVVFVPTYNEKENVENLARAILALNIKNLNILFVDDESPDGTGLIEDKLAAEHQNIKVLHRKERGRGSAGIAGFKEALAGGADVIIEMDADFSHDPKYIPEMLEQVKTYDVILGSRFVPGGQDQDRGFMRQVITKMANVYVRLVLGIHVRDCTSGFRCFRREVLEKLNMDRLISSGPWIVQEILYKCILNGFSIKEIPIVFIDRRQGQSTLGFPILLKGLIMVVRLKWMMMRGRI